MMQPWQSHSYPTNHTMSNKHSLYCADVPLRNCSLTHSLKFSWLFNVSRNMYISDMKRTDEAHYALSYNIVRSLTIPISNFNTWLNSSKAKREVPRFHTDHAFYYVTWYRSRPNSWLNPSMVGLLPWQYHVLVQVTSWYGIDHAWHLCESMPLALPREKWVSDVWLPAY